MPGSRETKVTIVIVPRERFSYALASLDSVLSNTSTPYRLVYVDTDSPIKLRRALKQRSHDYGFKLIRTSHFLTPNEARNLGMRHADTPFVAIMDNDVHCAPGWLENLLRCAEETGAAVVSPVITSGPVSEAGPDFETVHAIGGEVGFYERDGVRGHYERSGYSMAKLDRFSIFWPGARWRLPNSIACWFVATRGTSLAASTKDSRIRVSTPTSA